MAEDTSLHRNNRTATLEEPPENGARVSKRGLRRQLVLVPRKSRLPWTPLAISCPAPPRLVDTLVVSLLSLHQVESISLYPYRYVMIAIAIAFS